MATDYDVVIVGGRVAGASLAVHLAQAGKRVAVVDRAAFPSDTMSTHVVYPNTLARLDRLGVLDRVLGHGPPPLYTAWHHRGARFASPHTPEAGRDWALCVRRLTLDAILIDRAREAGAEVFERFNVRELLGSGTEADPVHGVSGRQGENAIGLTAPLVVGADGRTSTVAGLLDIDRRRIMPTQTLMMYAYWRDLPATNCQEFWFEPPWIGTQFPSDEGFHTVVLIGPKGEWDPRRKEEVYGSRIQAIAGLSERLRGGRRESPVIGTCRLEGYYRRAVGPGWLLTGDAGHFKHPAAVQGIADALQASEVLAEMILEGSWAELFEGWRDAATRDMFAFSRWVADTPSDEGMAEIMAAAARDPEIARGIVDIWSRAQAPWDVIPRIPAMHVAAGESVADVLAAVCAEDSEAAGPRVAA